MSDCADLNTACPKMPSLTRLRSKLGGKARIRAFKEGHRFYVAWTENGKIIEGPSGWSVVRVTPHSARRYRSEDNLHPDRISMNVEKMFKRVKMKSGYDFKGYVWNLEEVLRFDGGELHSLSEPARCVITSYGLYRITTGFDLPDAYEETQSPDKAIGRLVEKVKTSPLFDKEWWLNGKQLEGLSLVAHMGSVGKRMDESENGTQ